MNSLSTFETGDQDRAGSPPSSLTNHEFLETVGQGMAAGHCQRVISISGDPKEAKNLQWLAKPYIGQDLPSENNNYFTLCEDTGEGRGEDHFAALRVLGLDDIGTKAALPETAPSPTCSVETSPGNYQLFYQLDPLETDKARVRRAFSWLVHLKMTDKGAGLMSRVMRLPVGRNRKKEHGAEGFTQRTHLWNRGLSYQLDSLMKELGADMSRDPPAINAVVAQTGSKGPAPVKDQVILENLKKQRNTLLLMEGDGYGADTEGSGGDMKLAICIAYMTQDRDQFERVYRATGRSARRSSDNTQKWLTRADYRKSLYEGAISWVAEHPGASVSEISARVKEVVSAVRADPEGDIRVMSEPDFLEDMATLKRLSPGDYEHWRKQCKSVGKSVASLDAAVMAAGGECRVTDAEAANRIIALMGGRECLSNGCGDPRRYHRGIWTPMGDDVIKHAAVQVLPASQRTGGALASVCEVLKATIWEDRNFASSADKLAICCTNGVLFLTPSCPDGLPWTLLMHSPAYGHTAAIPHSWDADAVAPVFERLLIELFDSDEDATQKARWLKRFIGYSLTTSTDFEKFVILLGLTANNGKSTLLKVLRGLAGKESTTSVDMTQLDSRFGPAALRDKLICLVPELAPGESLPDKVIKGLCSGDTITGEQKGKNHFEFRPFATLWIATNHQPRVRDLSPATITKRAVVITMNRSFTGKDRDHDLSSKLDRELSAIFSVCVREWALALATEGASALDEPPSSVEAKRAWRNDADSVQQFIDDNICISPGSWVASETIYGTWKRWAERNGVTLTVPQQRLTSMIAGRCPSTQAGDGARRGGVRGLLGVCLLDVTVRPKD